MEEQRDHLELEELVALGLGSDIDLVDESDVLWAEIEAELRGRPVAPETIESIDHAVARAEQAATALGRQTAELWAAIAEGLRVAESDPCALLDPRVRVSDDEARDYARRTVVAELAVRMRLSETTVSTIGEHARRLTACPDVWAAFRAGRIAPANARTIAQTLGNLPRASWSAYDEQILPAATTQAPGRFRRTAHAVRDRVHRVSLAERHADAASGRRVVLEHDLDGMSWLSLHLPSEVAEQASGMIDGLAADLAAVEGEARTRDQLRADVAADLLLATGPGDRVRPDVQLVVTVPAATLLGGDEPAVLGGVGAIPATTARSLAALGSSFAAAITTAASVDASEDGTREQYRMLPTEYRLPESLKRHLRMRDRTCRFPGCVRRARFADIDHVREWQDGGSSQPGNLICLCRHHHRVKSLTGWRPDPPDPDTASVTWTSPTGREVDSDPPPF